MLIAVGTSIAHAIFVPDSNQIFNLVALSLLAIPVVAHWWMIANRVPQLVRAGDQGLFIHATDHLRSTGIR